MKKTRLTHRKLVTQKVTGLVIVAILTLIGVHLLIASHAQSPYSTANAGSGSLAGEATVQSGSEGQYVEFGYTPTNALAVHVDGDQLINGEGTPIRLTGVDASGTEDACILGGNLAWHPLGDSSDITEDASEDASYAEAMTTWKVNTVRVPLNEDCWLGINGAPVDNSAINYQQAIEGWVAALNNAGMVVILDLHWSAPGSYPANQQWPMADEDHTPTFWSQVASTFKSDSAVIFDPFNEPFMGHGNPTATDWSCWLSGCNTTFSSTINGVSDASVSYQTAGMQQLVTSIRNAGARQPIMVGGLNWAGDPCGLKNSGGDGGSCSEIANMPTDPDNQLAISLHTYSWTACTTVSCWNTVDTAAKAANLPLITGELGEDDCTDNYINSYMDWADQNDVSYLAWSWEINTDTSFANGASCDELQLLSNWNGTPSPISAEAADYQAHLLGL